MQSLSLEGPLLCGGRGRATSHPSRPENVLRGVCSFILVAEFCERLAYYGLSASLVIFFRREMDMSSLMATELNSLFASVSYLAPLVGAYVADALWGRYRTIVRFCWLYLGGLALCCLAAHPSVRSAPLFMLGLFAGVAMGAGGIKPNVVVLGADQFPSEAVEAKQAYFNMFYWAVNSGSVISYGLLTYLAVNGAPALGVSERMGFFASFLIPTAVFAAGLLTFVWGRRRYLVRPPEGSALAAFWARQRAQLVGGGGALVLPTGLAVVILGYFVVAEPAHTVLAALGGGLLLLGVALLVRSCARAVSAGAGRDAELLELAPYLGFMVLFWAVDGQMFGNYISQGCQMDLDVGWGLQLSAAQLGVADGVTVLLCIPVFSYFRFFGWSLRKRIGMGFACCAASMVVAALVELLRRASPLTGLTSSCDADVPTNALSVWWQVPQYILIGVSEVLTSVGAYELFYLSEDSGGLRSVSQALNLLTTTMGFMLTGAINSLLGFWLPSNLNRGRLDLVFLLLAALMLANVAGYVWFLRSHKRKRSGEESLGHAEAGAAGLGDPLLAE